MDHNGPTILSVRSEPNQHSVPQFLHLSNKENNRTCHMGLLEGLTVVKHVDISLTHTLNSYYMRKNKARTRARECEGGGGD